MDSQGCRHWLHGPYHRGDAGLQGPPTCREHRHFQATGINNCRPVPNTVKYSSLNYTSPNEKTCITKITN